MNEIVLTEKQNEIIRKSQLNDWSIPEFKLKNFVARSHIHPMHQLRQLMLELNTKTEMIDNWEFDREQFELEIELENEQAELTQYVAQKKLHLLEVKRIKAKLAVVNEKLRTILYEREKVLKLIDEIDNSPQGYTKDGRRYLDIMNDPEQNEEIERDYWEYRLAKQAAMDMIAYGRIGVGNMEAIMQLDADSQNKTIAMAYEVLIQNESRMNKISDAVVEKLNNGETVSDIHLLANISQSEFINDISLQLANQEKKVVPLIQKR
jgi:predicted DNA-binding protein YlxM (UPF0122 family)